MLLESYLFPLQSSDLSLLLLKCFMQHRRVLLFSFVIHALGRSQLLGRSLHLWKQKLEKLTELKYLPEK